MAALHEALKILSPTEFDSVPLSDLSSYLQSNFRAAQLLIDSIPITSPEPPATRPRSNTTSSSASSTSSVVPSSARPSPPAPEVEALQFQWGKPVRLNASQNPLGMSVYKLAGNDGKGAWFARRSVHEGLSFKKWKRGLEREFPESMKVQGGPGEGNIRGIGGERQVEFKEVDGVGKLAVYHLSAQFPGPTTPRDFVTLLLTSDTALTEGCGGISEDAGIPRHFMVVSKPCIHPDTPERDGFIRGQYQSVEFIRELPAKQLRTKSASMTDLSKSDNSKNRPNSSALIKEAAVRNAQRSHNVSASADEASPNSLPAAASDTDLLHSDSRKRGKTISFAGSRGTDAKGEHFDVPDDNYNDSNPVEWIMLTRSDPGGSVPRFMVERGTPTSIVADASKFLDWACSENIEEDENKDSESAEETKQEPRRKKELYDYQTNGHLAGIDGARDPAPVPAIVEVPESPYPASQPSNYNTGILGFVTGAASAAGALVAAHTPTIIASRIPGRAPTPEPAAAPITGEGRPSFSARRYSTSSSSSSSSGGSFASALSGTPAYPISPGSVSSSSKSLTLSTRSPILSAHDKQYAKLAAQKAKLAEKLRRTREKEVRRRNEDSSKEAAAVAKAEERHRKEVEKEERRYAEGVAKLEAKKEKEERKVAERRRKEEEKDERLRLRRELEEARAECLVLNMEKKILTERVGDLQRENTRLVGSIGKLGEKGMEVLKDVRGEKGKEVLKDVRGELKRGDSSWSVGTGRVGAEKDKEKEKEKKKENVKEPEN